MYLTVKVVPGTKKTKIEALSEATFKVWTVAPAEKGKANGAVLELLADHLGIKKNTLVLVAGKTSKEKIFERID